MKCIKENNWELDTEIHSKSFQFHAINNCCVTSHQTEYPSYYLETHPLTNSRITLKFFSHTEINWFVGSDILCRVSNKKRHKKSQNTGYEKPLVMYHSVTEIQLISSFWVSVDSNSIHMGRKAYSDLAFQRLLKQLALPRTFYMVLGGKIKAWKRGKPTDMHKFFSSFLVLQDIWEIMAMMVKNKAGKFFLQSLLCQK